MGKVKHSGLRTRSSAADHKFSLLVVSVNNLMLLFRTILSQRGFKTSNHD